MSDASRDHAPSRCGCGPMCEDKHRPGCRYFDVTPTRVALRALVDAVWQHATESTAVPSTDTADRLITKTIIPSHDAAPPPQTAASTGDLRDALKPFADLADAMYVSGHCGGASPEDWPDRWSISTTGGKDHHMPQAQGGVLTVADFRKLARLYHSLARNQGEGGGPRS